MCKEGVVRHTYNLSPGEAETGGLRGLMAWLISQVQRETLSPKVPKNMAEGDLCSLCAHVLTGLKDVSS